MTFRQYIYQLARQIGLHQVPVVLDASEIRYFLAEDAVHHEFVTALVRQIYKKNNCGHLDAAIDSKTTLGLLGNARVAVLAGNNSDICKIRLMNQFCEMSSEILSEKYQQEPILDTTQTKSPKIMALTE